MIKIKNLELWLGLIVIVIISTLYIQVATRTSIPAASGFFGHSLGVIGFVLMLMTEILYSIRKRYQLARWGKLQNWLSFHIFTGIVGPFLVLLHSSWKFNGLAGILTLFMAVIVLSGFVGRYFYTAVPRSTDGVVLEEVQISEMISNSLASIQSLVNEHPEVKDVIGISPDFGIDDRRSKLSKKDQKQKMQSLGMSPAEVEELYRLYIRQARLQRQLSALDRSRRLLAIWHTLHVPFGLAMFLIALVHIFATLYYATLLH